jgi:hypothetical protein
MVNARRMGEARNIARGRRGMYKGFGGEARRKETIRKT